MTTAVELRADSLLRTQRYLSQTLRWLFRQQLITGEMPAFRRTHGTETFCYPSPLISALTYEALGSADPRAGEFSRRLYDTLPAAERRPLICGAVTARWRLRCYIASQEIGRESCRRLYGRESDSDADAATSAICMATLWQDRGGDVELALRTGERLLAAAGGRAFAQAAALRLLALAGQDVREPGERLLAEADCGGVERAASVWMLTSAWRAAQDPQDREWPAQLLDQALKLHRTATAQGRLCAVLVALTLLMLNHRGGEVEAILHSILADAQPPWRWPQEPLYRDLSSPALTAALTVAAFAAALEAWREI